MYVSGIAAGIQAAHALTNLLVDQPPDVYEDVKEWCEEPTMILLNGGYQSSLQEIFNLFAEGANEDYYWGYFRESEEALNGALTNVCIILPEKIYMYDKYVREGGYATWTEEWDHTLCLLGTHYGYTYYEMKIVFALRGKRLMN
jgi:hypothetical protein